MKVSGLRFYAFGAPPYMRPDDEAEFVLGSGTDLAAGCVLRTVPLQDQWQLANARYGEVWHLVVSDFRGKEASHRMWAVTPTDDVPGRGVVLKPLHDGGTLFRGTKAYIVEPLALSNSLRPLIAHILSEASFNRVSVASGTKKGWADVSRLLSLLHGLGFVEPDGTMAEYAQGDPALAALKNDNERRGAMGPRANYRKTGRWGESFIPQWEAFQKSGAKTAEVHAEWSEPADDGDDDAMDAWRGDPIVDVGGDVVDAQAEGPDADLRSGVGAGLSGDAATVDEGPVQAPEVPDQDVLS